jgi:predicted polyphosphate/ATP-dependent NAD kinase
MNEVMLPDTLYILGAGTTTAAIAERLKVPKTLLGVDLVKGGRLVAADADERTILSCMEAETKVRIIVSPIGAQGFVLGRGNQQISAKVVRRAGTAGLICVATPHKMRETPTLYIDTGDPTLNSEFGPSIQVISGYRLAQRKQLYKNHATSD